MPEQKIVIGESRDPGQRIPGWYPYVLNQADAMAEQYSDSLERGTKKGEFLFACEIVRQCVEEGLSTEEKKRKLRGLLFENRLTVDMMGDLWEHAGGDAATLETIINDEQTP